MPDDIQTIIGNSLSIGQSGTPFSLALALEPPFPSLLTRDLAHCAFLKAYYAPILKKINLSTMLPNFTYYASKNGGV